VTGNAVTTLEANWRTMFRAWLTVFLVIQWIGAPFHCLGRLSSLPAAYFAICSGTAQGDSKGNPAKPAGNAGVLHITGCPAGAALPVLDVPAPLEPAVRVTYPIAPPVLTCVGISIFLAGTPPVQPRAPPVII